MIYRYFDPFGYRFFLYIPTFFIVEQKNSVHFSIDLQLINQIAITLPTPKRQLAFETLIYDGPIGEFKNQIRLV